MLLILAQNISAEPMGQVCHAYHAHLFKTKKKTNDNDSSILIGVFFCFVCLCVVNAGIMAGLAVIIRNHRKSLRVKSIKNNEREVTRALMSWLLIGRAPVWYVLPDTDIQTDGPSTELKRMCANACFFFNLKFQCLRAEFFCNSCLWLWSIFFAALFSAALLCICFLHVKPKICRRLFIINCNAQKRRVYVEEWHYFYSAKVAQYYRPPMAPSFHSYENTPRYACTCSTVSIWQRLLRVHSCERAISFRIGVFHTR